VKLSWEFPFKDIVDLLGKGTLLISFSVKFSIVVVLFAALRNSEECVGRVFILVS